METRTYWLSFSRDGFLGVCVVDVTEIDAAIQLERIDRDFPQHMEGAEWLAAAHQVAWLMRCNPGGEVLSADITGTPMATKAPHNRLMQRDELAERGLL